MYGFVGKPGSTASDWSPRAEKLCTCVRRSAATVAVVSATLS